jgi:hypothetical protein
MVAASNIFANALPQAFAGNIHLTADTLKMALLTPAYTPDLVGQVHFSDVRNHEVIGAGYTADGVTLTGVSLTLTAANSWGVTWGAATPYTYGQVVKPATPNGFLYRCVVAGVSGGSAPAFPTTVGQTVTDGGGGGVTWACLGDAILVFTSDPVTWAGATFSTAYAVIYDAQSGTYTTEPLIMLDTFATTESPSAQPFEVIPDSVLGWHYWSPPS